LLALFMGALAGRELAANRFTREAGRLTKRDDHAGAAGLNSRAAEMGIANFTPQSLVGVDFQLGESLRKSGQVEAAIAAYKADLASNPWAPETHNMLGAALGQWGNMNRNAALVEEGAQHLRTAAWLNPGYTTALLNLGGSYMVLGNVTGAAKAWEELLRYDPEHKEARAYLAGLKLPKKP
jgi:tetratricopeptide (TPR) repeat protein